MGPDSGRQKNKMIHCFRGPVRMSATSWSSSSYSRKVWYPSTTIYIFADNDLTTCLTYLFNLHDFVSACIIFHYDLSALDRSRHRTDWTGLVDRRTDRQPGPIPWNRRCQIPAASAVTLRDVMGGGVAWVCWPSISPHLVPLAKLGGIHRQFGQFWHAEWMGMKR